MTDFLDTNILVYAYDDHDPVKQKSARQLLEHAFISGDCAISAQVLSEFFVVVTRKITSPLSADNAARLIAIFRSLPVAEIDASMVESAVLICQQHTISFWHSLIIAAARRLGCRRILTEDLQAGQTIAGVEIVNPFSPLRPTP